METVTSIKLFPIVAHQGGWDEFLLVAGPLIIIGGLLWLANRRVSAQLEGQKHIDSGRPPVDTE